jgi:uncharacterized protein (TIGR00251 family)
VSTVESPPYAEALPNGIRLRLMVVPGASRDRIVGPHGDALRVQVAAPPEKGRANAAVVALLARTLGVRRKVVAITAGHGSRRKIAVVEDLPLASALRHLPV